MNKIHYEDRLKVYTNALVAYGEEAQMIVAIEELSEYFRTECQR